MPPISMGSESREIFRGDSARSFGPTHCHCAYNPLSSYAAKMTDQKASASDYLAAERTFLAWIRTGLALMGLGFVVARFGLFLQTLSIHLADSAYRAYGPSLWFGTALIILGVSVTAGSLWNFFRLVERLKQGNFGLDRPSWLAIAITIALAAAGMAMAIYLISVH
jgi:putative membrane protein